jgi:1-phosphatidylinositol phosphodiesterase
MKKLTKKSLVFLFLAATVLVSCEESSLQETVLSTTAADAADETIDSKPSEAKASSAKTTKYVLSKWMGSLDDTKQISEFSIPGTHDSGAQFETIYGTAKCQKLSIEEQLYAGVRYLDIRCRHINNAFTIHHGVEYQNINFTDVLSSCTAFLKKNPTETIIMSVQEEYTPKNNDRSFEATFDSYVNKNRSLWYLGDAIPTLESVKGKIVLARGFKANKLPKGIYRQDKTQVDSQNEYEVSDNGDKWRAIKAFAYEAKKGKKNKLYLNYTSGYESFFGIPRIRSVSDAINPKVYDFFATNTSGRFGVIVMDFSTAQCNDVIIKTNF